MSHCLTFFVTNPSTSNQAIAGLKNLVLLLSRQAPRSDQLLRPNAIMPTQSLNEAQGNW